MKTNYLTAMRDAMEQLQRLACDYASHGAVVNLRNAIAEIEKAEPVAYLTKNEDGDPAMLFFDLKEARTYCEDGEEPTPLYTKKDAP